MTALLNRERTERVNREPEAIYRIMRRNKLRSERSTGDGRAESTIVTPKPDCHAQARLSRPSPTVTPKPDPAAASATNAPR